MYTFIWITNCYCLYLCLCGCVFIRVFMYFYLLVILFLCVCLNMILIPTYLVIGHNQQLWRLNTHCSCWFYALCNLMPAYIVCVFVNSVTVSCSPLLASCIMICCPICLIMPHSVFLSVSLSAEFSAKSEDKDGNSLAFQFLSGAKVTVLASKTSRESDNRFSETLVSLNPVSFQYWFMASNLVVTPLRCPHCTTLPYP